MIKKREKSVLKNLNLKNTLFSLFYNGLMEIYFTPDFIEPILDLMFINIYFFEQVFETGSIVAPLTNLFGKSELTYMNHSKE